MFQDNEVSIPDLPPTKTAKNALFMVHQNGGDYKLPAAALLLAENNLADGDAVKMREALDIQSTEEIEKMVDEKLKELSDAIDKKLEVIDKNLNSVINKLSKGSVLIGELVEWPLSKMPQEIWADLGMVFIPYNGQSFDGNVYPDLALLHPDKKLPTDMRSEFVRGWDNGRGINSESKLLGRQFPTYLRTGMSGFNGEEFRAGTPVKIGMAYANDDSSTKTVITPPEGTYVHPNGDLRTSGGPFDDDSEATTGGYSLDNSITGVVENTGYNQSVNTKSGHRINWISTRPRNVAWNFIVRAK